MADINAKNYLDSLLATKPMVNKQGRREIRKKVCEPPVKFESSLLRPPECTTSISFEDYIYQDTAKVTNTRFISIENIKFDLAKLTSLPEKIHIAKKTIRNKSKSSSINSTVSLSVTGTHSWTVSKTEGVNTTIGATYSLSLHLDRLGSVQGGLSWNRVISTSTSVTESEQTSVTRTNTDSISVPANTSIAIELIAFESTAVIPFSAVAIIDGDLEGNLSNLYTASHILSETERTLPLRGELKITQMSEQNLNIYELKESDELRQSLPEEDEEVSYSTMGRIDSNYFSQFKTPSLLSRMEKDEDKFVLNASLQSEIGNPNGISYTVLYTEQVYRPNPACGFNDAGVPNSGVFNVEHRRYTNYVNGTVVASWDEDHYMFLRCWEV